VIPKIHQFLVAMLKQGGGYVHLADETSDPVETSLHITMDRSSIGAVAILGYVRRHPANDLFPVETLHLTAVGRAEAKHLASRAA